MNVHNVTTHMRGVFHYVIYINHYSNYIKCIYAIRSMVHRKLYFLYIYVHTWHISTENRMHEMVI